MHRIIKSNPSARRRRGLAAAAAVAAIGAVGVVGFGTANADSAPHKVTLCHATDSASSPYSLITVDYNSITKTGHGDHAGPVFSPGVAGKWGDIIPAFNFGDAPYPGMNNDEAGLAILANGCVVTPTTTTTQGG